MASAKQLPLPRMFHVEGENGNYTTRLPKSICFGNMVNGGALVSSIHAATADYFSKNPRTSSQTHVRSVAVNFLRPTFPDPEPFSIVIRPVNEGRGWSTAHVELAQKGKLCVVGYITMTNLDLPGITLPTKFRLLPAPIPTSSFEALEAGKDPNWVSYQTPFIPGSTRVVMSYVKYYIPTTLQDPAFMDQWMTPGWSDPASPSGPTWTNETLHVLADLNWPILDNFFPEDVASGTHKKSVAMARAQMEGRETEDKGEYTTPALPVTLSLHTEVKKRLPEEGVKWLFVRARTKVVRGARMDMEVVVLDEAGEVVLVSGQESVVADPRTAKRQRGKGEGRDKEREKARL